ncbi:BA75_05248T0 [Komagataella pastoris]|uniref:BA75_05248T0 n=1 Tax=Komagataella pastoris TaxID=4922 RepID=A0A1B2JIG4_PICPA|nr:BA75_05248T0 [Komagataella pastoris]
MGFEKRERMKKILNKDLPEALCKNVGQCALGMLWRVLPNFYPPLHEINPHLVFSLSMSTTTPSRIKLIAQGGHNVIVYKEAEKLKAEIILNNPQGAGKHYKGLEVCIDGSADLSHIRSLSPEAQALHVDLCLAKDLEPVKVVLRKNARTLGDVEKVPPDNPSEKESEKQSLKSSSSPLHGYGIYYKDFVPSSGTIGISVYNLDLSFEKKRLFADLDFFLKLGEKVTIVGDNGSGKTTFLKLISGVEEYAYSGLVVIEGRIAYLPQHFEDVCGDELAIVTLLKSLYDPDIDEFLTKPYKAFSSEWLQELNTLGGHEIFKQANHIGLPTNLLKMPFKHLSGGEKTKVMLCALSILEPDIILLDEPTNCLDWRSIEWLESFLKNFDGGVVMITHDRTLINAVSNRISELSPHTKKFTHFRGQYKHYLKEEEKRRQRLIEERKHQQKELKKLTLKANQAKGKVKSRIVRSGTDRDKLSYNNKEQRAQKGVNRAFTQLSDKVDQLKDDLMDVIPERRHISFDFDDNPAFSASLLSIEVSNVSKSFERTLFSNVSFTLTKGDRLIIQGPNGSGKSTLMKIIMSLIEPDEGSVTISGNAKVGYLDQEQESLPLDKSPISLLKKDPSINATDANAITILCNYGIYTWHDLKNPLKTLSIGCRRKAQLCQLNMRGSSILLLDEPTNHIDFPSLEFIEEALLTFPGIIIAATHDRYFTEKVGTRILDLSDCKA